MGGRRAPEVPPAFNWTFGQVPVALTRATLPSSAIDLEATDIERHVVAAHARARSFPASGRKKSDHQQANENSNSNRHRLQARIAGRSQSTVDAPTRTSRKTTLHVDAGPRGKS